MRGNEIAARLRARDESALKDLLERFGPLMSYVMAPILSSEADREECLSECCMRVWENIGSFDASRGSWTAWLTAIARNAALNRARTLRADAARLEPLDESQPAREKTPEEALLDSERRAEVLAAMEALSPGERALLYRKYYYCQSTAQIAAELGATERAVEGRLRRLRRKLRAALEG